MHVAQFVNGAVTPKGVPSSYYTPFPPQSNSSREVRDRLVQACTRMGVTFRYNASVEGIRQVPAEGEAAVQPRAKLGEQGGISKASGEPSSSEGGGSERPPWAAEVRLRGTEGRGLRRRTPISEPLRDEQRPVSVGWECELQDGSRHRCDRLVSEECPYNWGRCMRSECPYNWGQCMEAI